ncbi:MAG TPA: hypothetical protein VFB99_21125, partial [Vicinamibacterales bacterium]|nr:hypothetical protein [Vicinamibacterales bacterium]
LSSLIGLRAELASGDERFLYLGWLLDVQCCEIDDNAVEPARPEGLGNPTPALDSFIDIVEIDRDLVAAAAEGAPHVEPQSSARDIDRWLTKLDTAEHVTLLARAARGESSVGAELVRRFHQRTQGRAAVSPLRTVGALRAQAEAIAERRRKTAREREARERATREREEQAARDRYLTGLAKRERQAWQRVEALIRSKRPADYAAAAKLLVDLRNVSGRKGRDAGFTQRIGVLRAAHAKKPSLLARLAKAGPVIAACFSLTSQCR